MLIGTIKLYKKDLNDVHLFKFINNIMHVQVGDEWLIVALYDETTKQYKIVTTDNL